MSKRLDFLDGIRGWAAVLVVLSHIMGILLLKIFPFEECALSSFAKVGPFAVYIFFVLSGFVLSIKFIREPDNNTLALVVTSRFFRLTIPIFAIGFIAYLFMRFHLLYNGFASLVTVTPGEANTWLASFLNFKPSFLSLLSFSFYGAIINFHNAQYFEQSYISSAWTIPEEFIGSLLIYFVLGVFTKSQPDQSLRLPLIIVTIVLFFLCPSISCFLFGYYLAVSYYYLGSQIIELKYSDLGFLLLGLFSVLCVTVEIMSKRFSFINAHDQFNVIFAVMIVLSASFSRSMRSFFSCQISHFLGRISFPLYLVHMIVICSLSSFILIEVPKLGWGLRQAGYLDIIVTVFVSLCAANALWPVEKLSVKASKNIAYFLMEYDLKHILKIFAKV